MAFRSHAGNAASDHRFGQHQLHLLHRPVGGGDLSWIFAKPNAATRFRAQLAGLSWQLQDMKVTTVNNQTGATSTHRTLIGTLGSFLPTWRHHRERSATRRIIDYRDLVGVGTAGNRPEQAQTTLPMLTSRVRISSPDLEKSVHTIDGYEDGEVCWKPNRQTCADRSVVTFCWGSIGEPIRGCQHLLVGLLQQAENFAAMSSLGLRIPPSSGQPPKRRNNALGVVHGPKEAQEIQS